MSSNQESINRSLYDASALLDVSRSVDELRTQISIDKTKVPRSDAFKDVFDFLNEFEASTSKLNDSQRPQLLSQVFPVGCYRPWFETELRPLIGGGTKWPEAKRKIIERFSETEDQDFHFRRLRELKFDPEEGKSLLSFIEEVIYSYQRAHPKGVCDDKLIVRNVKAALPQSLMSSLNIYPEYRGAKNEKDLKSAARQYDLSKASLCGQAFNRKEAKEMATLVQDVLKSIRLDGESTRKAIVAALQGQSEQICQAQMAAAKQYYQYQSARRDTENYRPKSPATGEERRPRAGSPYPRENRSQFRRSPSPGAGSRSPVNQRRFEPVAANSYNQKDYNKSIGDHKFDSISGTSDADQFVDYKLYVREFGRPPSGCQRCGAKHWTRHCPFHLN